jgi:adenylyltransferase/sulfurtransferase
MEAEMSVKILIPTVLRQYAKDQDAVTVEGSRIDELLEDLARKYPDLGRHLFTEDGRLRNFVNVYVNDEDVRYLDNGNTQVKEGDVISIVPSVAGGRYEASEELLARQSEGNGELSRDELQRYSRHLIMPEVGVEGQKKLKHASVLLVGTGGLGSPLALYLAAAGVGRIGLVDFDVVDATNLQRQVIHFTSDIGRPKLESAREKINAINPFVQVDTYETRLTSENALEILEDYDIVIDGTDNFPTRYLVNDACVLLGKPNVYGSIFRFEGQASVFSTKDGPCYRCLYPEPPPPGLVPSCAEGGVLGILPGIIGVIQATEAVKLILGVGEPLVGRLLLFDALSMKFRELKLRKDPNCPICGEHPTLDHLIDYEQFCGLTPQAQRQHGVPEIGPTELAQRLDEVVLIDVREPYETQIASIPKARLIPLGRFKHHIHELDPNAEIVVHCRSGQRSAKAVQMLLDAGFKKVWNLRGGVLAWSDEVDPSVRKY